MYRRKEIFPLVVFVFLGIGTTMTNAFQSRHGNLPGVTLKKLTLIQIFATPPTSTDDKQIINKNKEEIISSYQDTNNSSKGVVSGLTGFVNFFFPSNKQSTSQEKDEFSSTTTTSSTSTKPPTNPKELMERIRDDYVVRNYLWTGNIDIECFDPECSFTDPTISFTGRDTFLKNTANLKVLVDKLTEIDGTKSDLLDISVSDKYVESRWNMIGTLSGLPWQPTIDVIGRTKFWFRPTANNNDDNTNSKGLQVYKYDEQWEMPASKALLQLITPGGKRREKRN